VGSAALAAASALIMALLLHWGGAGDTMPLAQTTLLTQPGSPVQFLARLEGGALTVQRSQGPAPAAGRSYQLWIIPQGGSAQSLGLMQDSLSLPAPPAAAYALAITDEPQGGAPGGVASGPVLAQGQFTAD
jgi:anti-sigma-K factor RskA